MKNTIGNSVILSIAGESHGDAIIVMLSGISPGIMIDKADIETQLEKRRPKDECSTGRIEPDDFEIVSGVFNGYTTGTPITIIIGNKNVRSHDYDAIKTLARPGHADYTAEMKYHGFQDYRGGGHFSGRVTAGIVAAGAICLKSLKQNGIRIGTHILSCGDITDRRFNDCDADLALLSEKQFFVLDDEAEKQMKDVILKAKNENDSVGGMTETVITGIEAGLGEPFFDSVESILSHLMFSIPGVKGIEFGEGFELARMRGSQANDPMKMKNGKTVMITNNNGGLNGGLTNGNPIRFKCAIKPTPSIGKEQNTINYRTLENAKISVPGRHDPAVIRRIPVIIDSMAAIGLCDLLALRHGTDFLRGQACTD